MSAMSSHKTTNRLPRVVGLLLCLGLLSMPLAVASADIGPKPDMEFEFVFETEQPLTVVEAIQYECSDPECSDAEPLPELGPQGIRCEADRCTSTAYGYQDYHRLEVHFSDGSSRTSDVFETASFSSVYRVTVTDDAMTLQLVRRRSNLMGWFFIGALVLGPIALAVMLALLIIIIVLAVREAKQGLTRQNAKGLLIAGWSLMSPLFLLGGLISFAIPITALIEGLGGLVYALVRKRPKFLTVSAVLLANAITLFPLWGAATLMAGAYPGALIAGEIVVWLVEAVILYFLQRSRMRFVEALLLSLGLNAVSMATGYLLGV